MARGCCGPEDAVFAPPRPRVAALLFLTIILLHSMTGGVTALNHGGGAKCRADVCARKYDAAVQQRVDLMELCRGLINYLTCLRENARSCRGDLHYHTTVHGLTRLVKEYDCINKVTSSPSPVDQSPNQIGPVPSEFPGRPAVVAPPEVITTPKPLECTYSGPHVHEMRHCGLFGDPHLKTFDGALQTCRVRGAWPLIDSRYLAVQVTNEPVRPGSQATVTTKITVIIKGGYSPCTSEKVYEAQGEYLPDTFADGTATSGSKGSHSVFLNVVEQNSRIEISIRHLGARLLIRRVAGALSFSAQMPLEIALPPGRDNLKGSHELCGRGCPASERLGHSLSPSQPAALQREEALAVCRNHNLSATYLEWCIFDVRTTGDKHFAAAAYAAQADVISLDPSADAVLSADAKWHHSSSDLPRVTFPLVLLVIIRTLTYS